MKINQSNTPKEESPLESQNIQELENQNKFKNKDVQNNNVFHDKLK
jgi:hypothetical protein